VSAYHCAQVSCTTQHGKVDNFPPYPPNNHYSADDVTEGEGAHDTNANTDKAK